MPEGLPPELERFVADEIASGRYGTRAELLEDAVLLLRERRLRLDELRLEILQGFEELQRGEGIDVRNQEKLRAAR